MYKRRLGLNCMKKGNYFRERVEFLSTEMLQQKAPGGEALLDPSLPLWWGGEGDGGRSQQNGPPRQLQQRPPRPGLLTW